MMRSYEHNPVGGVSAQSCINGPLGVGTYDLGDLEVRVFEEDGVLMAQATNQRALRMKYQGEHTFVLDAPQSIKLVFEL